MNYFKYYLRKHMFCLRTFLYDNIFLCGVGRGDIYSYVYHTIIRIFEIKSLVPRTSNLRDSTVKQYVVTS